MNFNFKYWIKKHLLIIGGLIVVLLTLKEAIENTIQWWIL